MDKKKAFVLTFTLLFFVNACSIPGILSNLLNVKGWRPIVGTPYPTTTPIPSPTKAAGETSITIKGTYDIPFKEMGKEDAENACNQTEDFWGQVTLTFDNSGAENLVVTPQGMGVKILVTNSVGQSQLYGGQHQFNNGVEIPVVDQEGFHKDPKKIVNCNGSLGIDP